MTTRAELWRDSEYRARHRAGCQRRSKDLVYLAKIGAASKGRRARLGQRNSPKHRARIAAALRGKPKSEEHKQKLRGKRRSEEQKRRIGTATAKRLARWPKPQTCLERALYRLLQGAGFVFEPEIRFGRYVVDAFVPIYRLGFEADGSFWHRDEERKARRDTYLASRGIVVIHLTENDLAPWVL